MNTAMLRSWLLAVCLLGAAGCGPRPAASSPAGPGVTEAAQVREAASARELARYAEREQQASGLEEFEGGRRRTQTTTIIIVLLVVIVILLLI